MEKMNFIRAKPLFHLSTFIMDRYDNNNNNQIEDDFDEEIHEYIYRIYHCSNRSQAVSLRTNAFQFIDQWRLKRLEQLDQRIRSAGQLVLNAFDEHQSISMNYFFLILNIHLGKRQHVKCPHRLKQNSDHLESDKSPTITSTNKIDDIIHLPTPSMATVGPFSAVDDHHHLQETKQNVEISINGPKPTSSHVNKTISFNLADFGRDFTFDTLARLSSSSDDIAMIVCENNTLIYSQQSNELVILSLNNPKHIVVKQLDKNYIIRDLCYVDWLSKCLVIANEQIYLLDYRTTECDPIESGIGYICGAIDNHRRIFYLVKQSTLYKYDKNALVNLKVDQYPIADGYRSQRIALDNKTNDFLALLVLGNDEKHYILVYSSKSFTEGYLYKIVIDDRVDREWICSNGNEGWLVKGTYPGSCFDLNIHGLRSVRLFDCNEIRNIISLNEHQRFIIRTKTEIFLLMKYSLVQTF
jgi:hypothetical protein